MSARRLKGRCYFCGDPCVSEWFCIAHLWAQGLFVEVDRKERPPELRIGRMRKVRGGR